MQNLFVLRQEVLQAPDVIPLDAVDVHGDVPLLGGDLKGRHSEGALLTFPLGVLSEVQWVRGNDSTPTGAEDGGGECLKFSRILASDTLAAEVFTAHQSYPSDGGRVERPETLHQTPDHCLATLVSPGICVIDRVSFLDVTPGQDGDEVVVTEGQP